MEKSVPVMTRIWPDLHPVLKRLAEEEHRSINALINLLIQEALSARGKLPDPKRSR